MRAIYAELSSEYAIILIQGLARVQMLGIDPYLGRARFVDFICVIVRVIAKAMLFFSLVRISSTPRRMYLQPRGCFKCRKEDANIGLPSNACLRHLHCASDES